MLKIYELPLSFNFIRRYVIFMFKRYYDEFIVIGEENIPTNCPVIFAPNHTNALMDAIALHAIVKKNMPLIFLARADIFNNKTVAKILRAAKILPAFRMRDGIENLGKNNIVFEECIEILENNKSLGIMPEGNQEIERNIRPIVKGIFRIAFASQQKFGNNKKVKILPIGLDFGDIMKSNKHIIINIGKPIEVAEYMKLYVDNPVYGTNILRDKLRDDLKSLTVNLETKDFYKCFEIAIEIAEKPLLDKMLLVDNTTNRFWARQIMAKKLIEIEKFQPQKIKKLDSNSLQFDMLIKSLNLKYNILEKPTPKLSKIISESLLNLLLFPFFIIGLLLNILPFFIPVYVRKKMIKPEFTGFFSSLEFGIGILTFPIFYIIQTLLFGLIVTDIWWVVLLFFLAQYPLGKISMFTYKKMKKNLAKLRYRKLEKHKSTKLIEAQHIRNQIINLIVNV